MGERSIPRSPNLLEMVFGFGLEVRSIRRLCDSVVSHACARSVSGCSRSERPARAMEKQGPASQSPSSKMLVVGKIRTDWEGDFCARAKNYGIQNCWRHGFGQRTSIFVRKREILRLKEPSVKRPHDGHYPISIPGPLEIPTVRPVNNFQGDKAGGITARRSLDEFRLSQDASVSPARNWSLQNQGRTAGARTETVMRRNC